MEKIKITKEQYEDFKHFTNGRHADPVMRDFIEHKPNINYSLDEDFTPQQFALLLCGWYEVQELYGIGDWIVYENEYHTCVMEVTGTKSGHIVVDGYHQGFQNLNEISINSPLIRLATPEEEEQEKERRKWAEIGREVNEYKGGDLIHYEDDFQEVEHVEEDKVRFWSGERLKTSIFKWNQYLTLVCPVELRFDKELPHESQ
ncbi:hypothetical protein [Halobacillus litoralis]|uniref:DUF1642 domain-containing protein n=1 Tax=Halobacillus litoralis TaxID=45668 RepID=A0A410MCC8_9BACI|nr:hypothetical protein [Halobacillus litoralis]QAS52404.1 hypothetical protein HLI_09240 [Halobacillus litoralis]